VSDEGLLAGRARALRSAFDRSFAEVARTQGEAFEELLTIRVAGDPYALRLAECAGLFVDRKITPLPTTAPGLLGLAGFRAALVPVYDLRALLGYPKCDAPRWMVSVERGSVVGLAFEGFAAHERVERDALVAHGAPAQRHVDRVARLPGGARPVLHLGSVLDVVEAWAKGDRQGER
jgi:purine-binding chemotaxis protein CheW